MTFMKNDKRRLSFLVLSVFLILLPLYLYSCSGGGYDDPQVQSATSSVLISPETLNDWVTNGYGTDSAGYNKLVVLDVASTSGATSYTGSGHVAGAFLLDTATDLQVARSEGIGGSYSDGSINTPGLVATSEMMNTVIRRTGIDQNTVVVITGDSLLNMGTAYFNFRYWGFPKERLKVLDRTNAAYKTAGFSLDTAVPPAPAASAYSVCDLTQNTSLRATLSDMINVAEGTEPNSLAWDVRTLSEYNGVAGSTPGPLGNPKKVAFEGHIKGAKHLNYLDLLDGAVIRDAETVKTLLAAAEITPDKTTHMY
ncbi:MAG: Rhodanese domain protein [Nitrospirae bacterium]|jgi:3-mercaptopyruvate sulfurtransferase SseA|nr:Rhodanese domain protein [Nitrospirota bacterium]